MPILIELTRILAAAQWNKQDFKYNYVALTDDANETAHHFQNGYKRESISTVISSRKSATQVPVIIIYYSTMESLRSILLSFLVLAITLVNIQLNL